MSCYMSCYMLCLQVYFGLRWHERSLSNLAQIIASLHASTMELLESATRGDVRTVRRLLKKEVDLNYADEVIIHYRLLRLRYGLDVYAPRMVTPHR